MKNIILSILFTLVSCTLFAQNKDEAEKLITDGITLHDKGKFNEAIVLYNKALEFDKDNRNALSEIALSLLSLGKYEESIQYCEQIIKIHAGSEGLKSVYVTMGNAFDGLKQPEKSIKTYDEGIKLFPDSYQLHFNKGITLSGINKLNESIQSFQKAVSLNPNHAGSHNALARVLFFSKKKKVPSLLAFGRFFIIEPEGNRAKTNLKTIRQITKGNVDEKGDNKITINIDSGSLSGAKNGEKVENNFSSTELLLALSAGLDLDEKNKGKSEVELFIQKIETICSSLNETQKDNFGFYWDYYVPYFIEMKNKNMIETFGHLVYASSDDPKVLVWLDFHKPEIEAFYKWSQSYEWKIGK